MKEKNFVYKGKILSIFYENIGKNVFNGYPCKMSQNMRVPKNGKKYNHS